MPAGHVDEVPEDHLAAEPSQRDSKSSSGSPPLSSAVAATKCMVLRPSDTALNETKKLHSYHERALHILSPSIGLKASSCVLRTASRSVC